MKTKWIVITKSTENGKYHCFDEVFESKKDALDAIQFSKDMPASYLHDYSKTRIVPINWNSIFNYERKLSLQTNT